MVVGLVFFIWLRVADHTDVDEEEEVQSDENCFAVFDILFGVYLGFLFFYMAFRSKIGCTNKNEYQRTRRELKTQSRSMNLIFGVPLTILSILILSMWYADFDRD